jgi:cation transporter-like permease
VTLVAASIGALALALVAGIHAYFIAGQFHSMITSREDGLLFQFAFLLSLASFFMGLCVTFLLSSWRFKSDHDRGREGTP